jgi:hypothetical protein
MSTSPSQPAAFQKAKPRPPASLFALGYAELPAQVDALGVTYRFDRLFKHDFFAATALYHRADAPDRLAVLKIQRTYPFYGFPMRWLGKRVANREIRIYQLLQGVPGIPAFLGTVGTTGFLHEFVPGTDLHARLPLTPLFFDQLHDLFQALHDRHLAYVDSNKRENILYGDDHRPWLIDFQISYHCKKGARGNFLARWLLRRFIRADWYHFYKHKTRLLPSACTPDDFKKARNRGLLHQLHRLIARPLIQLRRKFLSRYDLAKTR